jgi:hypothetical protein
MTKVDDDDTMITWHVIRTVKKATTVSFKVPYRAHSEQMEKLL